MLVGAWVGYTGAGEGYTGTQPSTVPGLDIYSYLTLGPYLRPNEGNFMYFMRFPRTGLRMGPEWVPEWLQN